MNTTEILPNKFTKIVNRVVYFYCSRESYCLLKELFAVTVLS